MRYLLIIITFLLLSTNFVSYKNITVRGDKFVSDIMGNFYITNRQEITKYNNDGIKICSYSNGSLGSIDYVDVSNPLGILLVYTNFNRIVVLDNSLSEINLPYNLDNIGVDQVELACNSNFGGFWIYNSTNMQLERYNTMLQLEQQSTDISMLINNDEQPNFLIEKNDYIFLNFPDNGIMIFDYAGNYFKTISVKDVQNLYIDGNTITYYRDNKIVRNNLVTFAEEEIILPDTVDILNAYLAKDKLLIFKEGWVSLYDVEK